MPVRSRSLAHRVATAFLLLVLSSVAVRAQAADSGFVDKVATIDGVKIHYITGGHGPYLLLLHGYAESSRMWRPVMATFGKRFTVIAPDLPGIGQSGIPDSGLNMKTSAIRIHDLTKSLGVTSTEVVGHDIGLMVAYGYAAMYRSEVTKLALMDAFVPGVGDWLTIYNDPSIWHFRFVGPTPEALVKGRERIYFEHFWNDFAADKTHSIPESDRVAYAREYAQPGYMAAGFAYFGAFNLSAKDFAVLARNKLTIPLLTIGGDKSLGVALAAQAPLISTSSKTIVLKNKGHWILEEAPQETMDALLAFL